jgi:transposase
MRAAPLGLRDGDRERLVRLSRAASVRAGLAQRARIVLLAADGVSHAEIGRLVGVSRPTVIGWRERYEQAGLAGLADRDRPGRPRTVDRRTVVA